MGNSFTDKLPVNGHSIPFGIKSVELNLTTHLVIAVSMGTNLDRTSVKKYIIIQQGFVSAERQRFHPKRKSL